MNIGQAAKASGVSAKMIRYYEQTGLIPKADRRDSGYRDYSPGDVNMLRFIRRARDLGFAVTEINELLNVRRARPRHSADVKRIAQSHIFELQDRIKGLNQMVDTLQGLVSCCAGDDRPDCPIIADLEEPSSGSALPAPASVGIGRLRHRP